MERLSIRIAAVAAAGALSLGLAACGPSSEDADGAQKFGAQSLFDPIKADPTLASPIIPFPFDGLFSGFSDPTLNIPNSGNVPFVTAANLTDGFSTVASIFTDLTGFVDYSTAAAAIVLVDSSTGTRLQPGLDYTVQPSTAIDASAPQVPLNQKRSRILIEPLHPLKPSTTYLVGVTTALLSLDGIPATASDQFRVVRSGTAVALQDEPILSVLNPTQLATLEVLRSSLIRPAVQGLMAVAGLTEDELVLAWSFTTQSTSKTMQKLNAAAVGGAIGAVNTGFTTQDLNAALPPVADVYAGTVTVPYYLSNSGGDTHSTAPLTGFWAANPAAPDLTATFLGQVPCGAFAIGATLPWGATATPSASTTTCFPLPLKQSDAVLPMLVTVPNGNSGQSKPQDGWPVVIFQHGITGNRSQMLAIAPAFAAAGFAVVAIDLPLHGIVPTDAAAALRMAGLERSYDLDLVNNTTGAAGPDGVADASGTHFINLSSLITSRDNLRQAASDIIILAKSVPSLDLDGDSTPDIDGSRIHFAGLSLGAMVGAVALGVNSDIRAASLAVPGGGIAKLLDASKTFGPRIAAGLAGSGVIEGTDNYETFLRFAQQLVDSGDPVNYAAPAADGHPLHLMEVIGDTVVPNTAPAGAATSTLDTVRLTGFLSGTDPLIAHLGADVVESVTPPLAYDLRVDPTRATDWAVQFAVGTHGSLLTPAGPGGAAEFLAVTTEMQREAVNFIASDGICLPLGGSCPQ